MRSDGAGCTSVFCAFNVGGMYSGLDYDPAFSGSVVWRRWLHYLVNNMHLFCMMRCVMTCLEKYTESVHQ